MGLKLKKRSVDDLKSENEKFFIENFSEFIEKKLAELEPEGVLFPEQGTLFGNQEQARFFCEPTTTDKDGKKQVRYIDMKDSKDYQGWMGKDYLIEVKNFEKHLLDVSTLTLVVGYRFRKVKDSENTYNHVIYLGFYEIEKEDELMFF